MSLSLSLVVLLSYLVTLSYSRLPVMHDCHLRQHGQAGCGASHSWALPVTQGAGFLSCQSLQSRLPSGGGWHEADGCGAREGRRGSVGTGLAACKSPTTAVSLSIGWVPRSPAFLGACFGPWLLRCGPVCFHCLGYFSSFLVHWRVPSLISRSLFMLLGNFFCCFF